MSGKKLIAAALLPYLILSTPVHATEGPHRYSVITFKDSDDVLAFEVGEKSSNLYLVSRQKLIETSERSQNGRGDEAGSGQLNAQSLSNFVRTSGTLIRADINNKALKKASETDLNSRSHENVFWALGIALGGVGGGMIGGGVVMAFLRNPVSTYLAPTRWITLAEFVDNIIYLKPMPVENDHFKKLFGRKCPSLLRQQFSGLYVVGLGAVLAGAGAALAEQSPEKRVDRKIQDLLLGKKEVVDYTGDRYEVIEYEKIDINEFGKQLDQLVGPASR